MPWYEVLIRLGLATLFGMIIGLEREHRGRPAGIKTHILVCVGAAVVSLIQVYMIEETIKMIGDDSSLASVLKADIGRLGAQVISGIGFLGAGTILRDKGSIKGLTTAATLWLTACVGLAVGMGYYLISAACVILVMIVLVILHLIQNLVQNLRGLKRIEVSLFDKDDAMDYIANYCASNNITIKSIEFAETAGAAISDSERSLLTYVYTVLIPRTTSIDRVLMDWKMNQHIISAVDSDHAAE